MRCLFLFIFLISINNTFSQRYSLDIVVPNIPKVKGHIQIGLYNDSEKFPKVGKEFKRFRFKTTKNKMRFRLNNLTKGTYAIAIYHDINSDKKCNRNFLGIPTEDYGFSNDVKPVFSAPSFKSAAFTMNKNKTITIKLQL